MTQECDTNPYNSKLILKSRGRRGRAECGGVTLNAGGEEKVVEKGDNWWRLVGDNG